MTSAMTGSDDPQSAAPAEQPDDGSTRADPLLPETFSARAARRILSGDVSALDSFVAWVQTAQGHEFWAEENRVARDRGRLSRPATAALKAMLDRYRMREAAKASSDVDATDP